MQKPNRTTLIKNRIIRIYPLYLLALIAYTFTVYPYINKEMPNIGNFIIHALCLQYIFPSFFQQNYHTIWFVSALFCCYVFFLSSRHHLSRPWAFIFIVTTWMAIITIFPIVLRSVGSSRIFSPFLPMYIGFFAFGMAFGKYEKEFLSVHSGVLGAIALGGAIVDLTFHNLIMMNAWLQIFGEAVAAWCATIPVFIIFLKHTYFRKIPSIIVRLAVAGSYASMTVFLFHRPIWTVMARLWGNGASIAQFPYITILGTALIWFISFYIQTAYDLLLRVFTNFSLRIPCCGHTPPLQNITPDNSPPLHDV